MNCRCNASYGQSCPRCTWAEDPRIAIAEAEREHPFRDPTAWQNEQDAYEHRFLGWERGAA